MSGADTIHQTFTAALDRLIAQVKDDRTILAAVLCGSLSHDTVWARSDIDLVFVTVDERDPGERSIALYADGVNVHALLIPRAAFRRTVEGAVRSSFEHSFLARGRLLYTHDPTIETLFASLQGIGTRDTRLRLLHAGICALGPIDKAHKWLLTRGDLDYTALWILYAATPLAQIEVISAGQLVDREVIPQAARLNPPFFQTIYSGLLNTPKTRTRVQAALDAVDAYVARRATALFEPVLAYLDEVGDIRSCRDLELHFSRNFGVDGVTTACEYLAARGLVGTASAPARLTKKSNIQMQELAFFSLGAPDRR